MDLRFSDFNPKLSASWTSAKFRLVQIHGVVPLKSTLGPTYSCINCKGGGGSKNLNMT